MRKGQGNGPGPRVRQGWGHPGLGREGARQRVLRWPAFWGSAFRWPVLRWRILSLGLALGVVHVGGCLGLLDAPTAIASSSNSGTLQPPSPKPAAPTIQLSYHPAQGRLNQRVKTWLEQEQSLERWIAAIHPRLRLRQPLQVQFRDCGTVAELWRYEGSTARLTLCYELLVYLEDHFDDWAGSPRERQLGVLDATTFIVARELGQRILLDGLGAPNDRRLPPAFSPLLADKPGPPLTLAAAGEEVAIALSTWYHREGSAPLLAGIQWIFNQGNPAPLLAQREPWGRSGYDATRYDALVCLAYGANPEQFPFLREDNPVAFQRWQGCDTKAQERLKRWRAILKPQLKS